MNKKTGRTGLLIIVCLLAITSSYAHDWVNHIQTRLSDKQIKRDVKSMHAAGKTVEQTIENALREQHAKILIKIKKQLHVPDDAWQEALQEIEDKAQELRDVLYSKENIHDCHWFISKDALADMQDSQEKKQWNQLRIVAKNTLLDFGINPKNIYIYSNDASHLSYLEHLIQKEPSWWQRQKIRFVKGLNKLNYALSPVWCTCDSLTEKPQAEIAFNMSAMAYFEPIEQRGLFGHEVTHLIEGHLQEQTVIMELEEKYGTLHACTVKSKTARDFFHNRELMADLLPALKNVLTAHKCCDAFFSMGIHWPITSVALHPLVDSVAPALSTHPLTIYRRRAMENIVRYLEYEQTLETH